MLCKITKTLPGSLWNDLFFHCMLRMIGALQYLALGTIKDFPCHELVQYFASFPFFLSISTQIVRHWLAQHSFSSIFSYHKLNKWLGKARVFQGLAGLLWGISQGQILREIPRSSSARPRKAPFSYIFSNITLTFFGLHAKSFRLLKP